MMRIILNGKKADQNELRSAIATMRSELPDIEVRVTWEHGDARRFVHETSGDGIRRIVAAGGDGTVNEVVNGLAKMPRDERPELAILPLGTANDFAGGCNIPLDPLQALHLAAHGAAKAVDIVRANDRYFINVASGGFVAQATADTPPQLKNFLGGGAYALTAVVRSLTATHGSGRLLAEDIDLEGSAIVGVVCNGRQAGGGQVLAPDAYIDDGLLDVMVIMAFPFADVGQVIKELVGPSEEQRYIRRFRTRWVDSWPHQTRTVNLDGEPYQADHIRFDVMPAEIDLVLPEDCPCLLGA